MWLAIFDFYCCFKLASFPLCRLLTLDAIRMNLLFKKNIGRIKQEKDNRWIRFACCFNTNVARRDQNGKKIRTKQMIICTNWRGWHFQLVDCQSHRRIWQVTKPRNLSVPCIYILLVFCYVTHTDLHFVLLCGLVLAWILERSVLKRYREQWFVLAEQLDSKPRQWWQVYEIE